MRHVFLRAAVPGTVVAALLIWVGPGPFLRGIAAVSPATAVAALAITALSTGCAAIRWRLVAARLGDDIPLGSSIAWYYRSQLLNSVLPVGIAGDLHRGLARGITAGAPGGTGPLRSLRAVAWERLSGQVVGVVAALVVVLLLGPAPLARAALWFLAAVAVGLAATGVVLLLGPTRVRGVVRDDLRALTPSRSQASWVAVTSVVATAGHATVFVIAARSVLPQAGLTELVPVALVVLLGASVPLSLAGWGPREGAAAGAFAAIGLGAANGVEVSAAYGALSLIAVTPGLIPLLAGLRGGPRRRRPAPLLARPLGGLDG